jgi:hypothetical protein
MHVKGTRPESDGSNKVLVLVWPGPKNAVDELCGKNKNPKSLVGRTERTKIYILTLNIPTVIYIIQTEVGNSDRIPIF